MFVFLSVLTNLLLPAQAAYQNNNVIPTLSLLLLGSKNQPPVTQIQVDAVIGESIMLGDLLFPDLVATNDLEISDKWDEIDAIYEALALIAIPPGYTNLDVCDNLDLIPNSELILGLDDLCSELTTALEEFSNLQEVVNYAADYLWESNNREVALVNGNGIAIVTNEGIATISVTDPHGNHTHDIIINAQRVVQTIRELDIQNEKFVTIDEGKIQSYNADGSVKAEKEVTVESYEGNTGDVVLSGPGANLASADQLITFSPCTVFPDGMLRSVTSVTDNGDGTFTLATSEGSLAEVITTLDLEHKESVDANSSESTPGDNDLETMSVTSLAPGVKMLTPEEFKQAVASSDRGREYLEVLKSGDGLKKNDDILLRATLSGDWSPDFAFEFNKTDSQDGESDGYGDMGISGIIGFKMPIHIYMRYADWKLRRFDAYFKPTQYTDIRISVDGDADIERTLAEVRGPSIKFFIGPLPVYVRPIFEISVGGSAEGDVVLDVVDYEVWNKYGVTYTRGRSGPDWRPVAHYNRQFNPPSLLDGNYSLGAWGQVKPKLRFYGLGGPYAKAKIGARLTADTSKTEAGEDWARLRSFVIVSTGVEFDITVSKGPFDYTIVDYEKNFGTILKLYRTEWDSNGPYAPAP